MSTLLPLAGLRRLLHEPIPDVLTEVCHRCGTPLPAEHRHVADVESRSLRCVCAGCLDSMSPTDAEAPTHRPVPRRYLRLPPTSLGNSEWDGLEVPVGIVFFFHNSALGRVVAAYPSPAGATESLLPPESWRRLLEVDPATRTLAPDVEALLVRRTLDANESFIVPIDACYELVGRIRKRWSGFGGGAEVQEGIADFFETLRARSEERSI